MRVSVSYVIECRREVKETKREVKVIVLLTVFRQGFKVV